MREFIGRRIRSLLATILVVMLALVGVSLATSTGLIGEVASSNLVSDFNDLDAIADGALATLPKGWTFSVDSGTYRYCVKDSTPFIVSNEHRAHSIEFGGTGGAAELLTNACIVPRNWGIECSAWIKSDLMRDAAISVFLMAVGEETPLPDSPMVKIQIQPNGWQQIRFAHFLTNRPVSGSIRLAVRLEGEALVEVRGLSLKQTQKPDVNPIEPEELVKDTGFEELSAVRTFRDWIHHHDSNNCRYEIRSDSPHGGNSYVRLEGKEGWGVLTSKRRLQSKRTEFVARAYVRAHRGIGGIKIEYLRNNTAFDSTCSEEATDEWGELRVESDPALAAVSDEVCVSLFAKGGEDSYKVDFDDVEISSNN